MLTSGGPEYGPSAATTAGAANDDARKEYGQWFAEIMRHEWFANGVMMGYRYDDSPIVWPDGTPAPPDLSHPYIQIARPGARAPHVWLRDGRSTLDLYGRSFVLLRLGNVPTAHIEEAAKDRGVPLTVAALDEPDVLAAYQRKLVLVRPDSVDEALVRIEPACGVVGNDDDGLEGVGGAGAAAAAARIADSVNAPA